MISSSLVVSENLKGPRKVATNTRVYVLARADSVLHFPAELVEDGEGFELPDEKIIEKRKIFTMQLRLRHFCVENVVVARDPGRTWFRLSSFVRAFT
ncbi:unnamed protein product [Gongylonema pulchrum]|uniref:Rrp44_S1 domain-containing protein n=1 Tax=Gongylonema pulchrum TaxID=637853 RepID=A0A183DHM1_9BILA|nr:unnamed protein product [Gongylonema pulchrum]